MTKLTMLHFASPFAFSMPAPSRNSAAPGVTPARQDRQAVATAAAVDEQSSSRFAADDTATVTENAVAATESAGFEASFYETVLRRYLEQQPGSGTPAPTHSEGEDQQPN